MLSLCVGALLVGCIAGFLLPAAIFVVMMLVSVIIGATVSICNGMAIGNVIGVALACIVLLQLGYGIGLLSRALAPAIPRQVNLNYFVSALRAMISSRKTS